MEAMLSILERGPRGGALDALGPNLFAFGCNTDGSSAADFMLGEKVLVEGSFYAYEDYLDSSPVVIIEKNLAEQNGIGAGDAIAAEISGESWRTADWAYRMEDGRLWGIEA